MKKLTPLLLTGSLLATMVPMVFAADTAPTTASEITPTECMGLEGIPRIRCVREQLRTDFKMERVRIRESVQQEWQEQRELLKAQGTHNDRDRRARMENALSRKEKRLQYRMERKVEGIELREAERAQSIVRVQKLSELKKLLNEKRTAYRRRIAENREEIKTRRQELREEIKLKREKMREARRALQSEETEEDEEVEEAEESEE